MGETSNALLIVLSIQLFCGIIALGIISIDPTSDVLLGNHLFGYSSNPDDNLVISSINNDSGVYSYDWNTTIFDSLGSEENAVLTTTGSIVPDWIKGGWKFITNTGRNFLNIVGAPYTILAWSGIDTQLSALIGSMFGLFFTFLMLNWILGRNT